MDGNQGANGKEARKEDAVEFGPIGHEKGEWLTLIPGLVGSQRW